MTRRVALAAACVCIAIALLFARPTATPGPFERDFEAYWSAGATWNAHADPYSRAVWSAQSSVPGVDASRDELLPFVGPPATLLVWSPLARLPYPLAAELWWGLLALALLALLRLIARASGTAVDALAAFALVALAVAFGPVTSDLALGQVALIALLGASAVVANGDALGAVAATFQPNVSLGVAAILGRNRETLALCIGAAIAYGAGALADGPSWPVRYARLLADHGAAERFSAIQIAPAAIAYGYGLPASAAIVVGALCAAAAVAAAIAVAVRTRETLARFAAISALAPFVAGFFHEHDLVAAFPAALLCALRARGRVRALAICGTLLTAIDWLGLAQRPSGIAQSALLAAAAVAAFTALAPGGERFSSVAAIAIAALFAASAWVAAHHPASVWPDALGAFHAGANAGVAEVWGAEQRASGLLAANPVWAYLRALSLLGCAMVAAAAMLTARRTAPRPL